QGGGNGGTITIDTGSGGLITEGGLIDASATCGTGGTVTFTLSSLTVRPGANQVLIRANGGGKFAGGNVAISLANVTQDLVIGDGPGQFEIEATGGEPFNSDVGHASIAGDGGTVKLQSAHNLTVDTNNLTVGPIGDGGGGAKLDFKAAG